MTLSYSDAASPTASPALIAARAELRAQYRAPEEAHVATLLAEARLTAPERALAMARAESLVAHVRAERRRAGGVDALMQEYDLSSSEGVTLMCLAEALLRIPDNETIDDFIEDKLGGGDWAKHLGGSESFFVNASTWGLMLAGRTVRIDEARGPAVARLVRSVGEPVIRQAVRQAMKIMGRQFVMGRSIEAALKRAAPLEAIGWRHSYDMLGEAARTMADADRYMAAYEAAIDAVGAAANERGPIQAPGISVKLSALHPRYEHAQAGRVHAELTPRLLALCERAAKLDIGLCIDAEEADRLDLSLDLVHIAANAPETRGWEGLGLAVQAYQKRARGVIDWLIALSGSTRRRLLTRLVKGAYWDTEIKRAQEGGFVDYPVFTRKTNTDVSYLACARAMLGAPKAFYPCFATHNAVTLESVRAFAGGRTDYEFQRLHGMGEALYEPIVRGETPIACRVYAPVGGHEDLLAYLVRRLLENGANTSFVNRIADDALPIDEILTPHAERALTVGYGQHPQIPAPAALYGDQRVNSAGLDLTDPLELDRLLPALAHEAEQLGAGRAITPHLASSMTGSARDQARITDPASPERVVGHIAQASAADARSALDAAWAAQPAWAATSATERADMLRAAAYTIERDQAAFITLLGREGGRTVRDAHLEVREAVDFLRYYAAQAERLLGAPTSLVGPTGETNFLRLTARGPFLCISPWNFPLAIFLGQIAAALAAGNCVLAKPAEQTPVVADRAVRALYDAGVPVGALQFLPGDGPTIGSALLADPRLAGVAFTGSTQTARIINRALAERDGPIATLIAETGGVNAMIADSTALPEQVTRDVIAAAFQSAGQRCSALRLLCLQEDVAPRQIAMIGGAMAELKLGDPLDLATDVGPVIDAEAHGALTRYIEARRAEGRVLAEAPASSAKQGGLYVRPVMVRLDRPADLSEEIFGPVLHVATFKATEIDALVETINASGYGLTLGVHSRSQARIDRIVARARVGNIYVNRNQIGAVVGVQPFGGEGLSGTGPKAGGPHYLARFCTERVVTTDTTASGGNASLMTMEL